MFDCCFYWFFFSKYVYSPTITIVTREVTVILAATESDYERSIAQHDLWYKCLDKKLRFGSNFHNLYFALSGFDAVVWATGLRVYEMACD